MSLGLLPWEILLLCLVSFLFFIGNHYLHVWHVHYIPEGGVAIILGIIVGGFDYLVGGQMKHMLQLKPALFQVFFLPPIIFDAGLTLNRKIFLADLGTILLFAVVGTLVTALLLGMFTYGYLDHNGFGHESLIYECLLWGALISATDPVASLAVFAQVFKIEEKPQPPLVYNLVFGESILNDAVAIVLYKSFEEFLHEPFHPESVGILIGSCFEILIVSCLIGASIACLTALVFKHFSSFKENFNHQFFMMLVMSYSSYLIAEAIHFSGILAVFVCGMIQSAYTWKNLTPEGRDRLPVIFHSWAMLTENLIFCYLGMALFAFHGTHVWDAKIIAITLVAVLLIRIVPVTVLSALANTKRETKIDWRRQVVLIFAGLRGAIAFVLAVEMANLDETPNGKMFMSCTLVICLFTTFVEGTLTRPLLKALKLDTEEEPIRGDSAYVRKWDRFANRWVIPFLCVPENIDGVKDALPMGKSSDDPEEPAGEHGEAPVTTPQPSSEA